MPDFTDMPIDDFRRQGHRAIDWIADYLANPERFPVLPRVRPGEVRNALPASPPATGESMDAILTDFERHILPGITHWNHPGFFAYFSITGSGPGILGELLSAALNVNAMLWQTSPAATELEELSLAWLRSLVGLPEDFEGVIYDTASISTFSAVAAARHACADLQIRDRGMAGRSDLPRLRLYTSEQAHSSVEKAAIALGIGRENVQKIPTDSAFRMDVAALRTSIDEDRAAGFEPFCVVATVGTTSTTSSDPVGSIADVCEREDLWLHVDAAYAGAAAIVPEYRDVLAGCDRASSIVINPHKWLFTPIDCSALFTRSPGVLTRAFSLIPEYLRTDIGDVRNYMDYGIQLGRRFRALKLWMVLRYFGSNGIAERLRRHVALAQMFAHWVDEDPDFERLAPTPLSVVCFRARPKTHTDEAAVFGNETGREASEKDLDDLNMEILNGVNASGEVYLSHTRLDGRYALRLAVGNIRTTEKHVRRAWELLRGECDRLGGISNRAD